MGEIPHSEKMFHLPIEVSVYVPSTQDVDKVVSKSEMKLRVEEVKKYLATLFGGFSSSSVEGGFLASDGKVVKENVERVVSFAEKSEFDKNKEALVQKASEWAAKWGQEAIGLEHEGDLYYVPQKFENGGTIAIREAKEMANSQAIELKHHVSELANILKKNPTIEAWVIAKLERASNDLSDVTHYLDGRVQMSGKKMATGGNLPEKMIKVKVDYLEQQYFQLEKEIEIPFSEYKEYDKTGKVSRELIDDLISETSLEHHVETNAVSVRLTPITADKMATGGNTSTPMVVQIKIFDEQETSFLSWVKETSGKSVWVFTKTSISKAKSNYETKNTLEYKSYDSMLNAARKMANDKSTLLIFDETGKGQKYLLKDYFNKSAQESGQMKHGGGVSSNEPQFIKYKDEEIMYEPHFKEYYVNDSMFHSLEEAKEFIDGGAPMSPEIKEAYRKGLFKDGGNILLAPNKKPSKLTPEQYKLVRTPEFKAWFGDWENDPKNASKVVDEDTKEPLVVYHGSNSDFNIFEKSKTNPYAAKQGYFFAFNKKYAESYNSKYVKPFFINIKIAGTFDDDDNIFPSNADGNILQGLQVEVYDNKNIKLADGSNTTFNGRKPDVRFDAGGNMEFERPSYQSNYVASQAQANEIADDKWNMDYENDPLIKAQKKAKEIAKKVKETAKRAAMAYATKGMSETNRQTNGAAGGASEGGDEMSGANKMDMASMFKGMK